MTDGYEVQLGAYIEKLSICRAERERLIDERDKYKREADTLAETLRITQTRCTELMVQLRLVEVELKKLRDAWDNT